MQFAGGMQIARVAEAWDRDADWVESAIRRALLASIPQRDGGLKATRKEVRVERGEEIAGMRGVQASIEW